MFRVDSLQIPKVESLVRAMIYLNKITAHNFPCWEKCGLTIRQLANIGYEVL